MPALSIARTALATSAVLLGLVGHAALADANTYAPTRLDDPIPGKCKPSDCSLREALIAANRHGGRDTIVARGGKVYGLTISPQGGDDASGGDLNITDPLTITHSGHKRAAVDAGAIPGGDGVFFLSSPSGASVTLSGLVIRNGSAGNGGGIFVKRGSLKLSRSIVSGNFAGGDGGGIEHNGGSLSLLKSAVKGNISASDGGGINAIAGSLTIKRSSVSGNTIGSGGPDEGGGIATSVPAVIQSSTVSGNKTISGDGGGIFAQLTTAKLTMTNYTLANNSAAGGGDATLGNGGGIFAQLTADVSLNDVTIAHNRADADNSANSNVGGGFRTASGASLSIENSLVVSNAGTGGEADDCNGAAFTDLGHNLSTTGCVGGSTSQAKIGPLANNGGPTKTIALLGGSPAIDHGSPRKPGSGGTACAKTDQRGVKRPQGERCDVGAYERKP